MTNFLCYCFKFNKFEEPFEGVVEWFNALVLKTSKEFKIKTIYSLRSINITTFLLRHN